MADLTDNELKAIAYYAIGVGSEGSDRAYQLSFAGRVTHDAHGVATLTPVAASGYSIGTLQTDLGQHAQVAGQLVDTYQSWARTNHPELVLSAQQRTQTVSDLSRDGHRIHDVDHGRDIDPTIKANLNTFLASKEGVDFIHERDTAQVNNLMRDIAPLRTTPAYLNSSPEDQARMAGVIAKAYNQSPSEGATLLQGVQRGTLHNAEEVSRSMDGLQDYMTDGRDHTLKGVELFNTLRSTSATNSLHAPWQSVVADPLVNPNQLDADPTRPQLRHEYLTMKDMFVDPDRGRELTTALEANGSMRYGNPSTPDSRGYYASGNDFIQWNKKDEGRAFVGGSWSDINRADLSRVNNHDHTIDLNINRGGTEAPLLHIGQSAAALPRTLHQGAHGDDVGVIQGQLAQLGYTDSHGLAIHPDNRFGRDTKTAVEAFQRDHGLTVNGIADSTTQTQLASQAQTAQQAPAAPVAPGAQTQATPMRMDDPAHPAFPMFQQARTGVHQLDAEQGRVPDRLSENIAGALAASARSQGMNRIDAVALSDDGTRVWAAQHIIPGALNATASVAAAQAVNTPLERSTEAYQQAAQAQSQVQTQQQQQLNQQTQQSTNPTMQR